MKRFEVWLVNLDSTMGREIKKTRPAIVVSPNELNDHLATVIVVPLTTGRSYPFRMNTRIGGKEGVAAVDQIRTVDKKRLVKKLEVLPESTGIKLLESLGELFAP